MGSLEIFTEKRKKEVAVKIVYWCGHRVLLRMPDYLVDETADKAKLEFCPACHQRAKTLGDN